MTELLQFATVILLAFVWRGIGKASTRIAQQAASISAYLDQMDERLRDIEERLRDNFKTDEERQLEANSRA
jgi:predicted PurR-regulated permease PerM